MRRFIPSAHRLLPMLAAALVFLLVGASHHSAVAQQSDQPQGSPANANLETVDASGNRYRCDSIPEAKGGVLLGKMIPCLVKTIETGAVKFSREFIDWMKPIFYAFLTFVIVMFGLKVLQGEGQLQAQGIVLLLKIGMVLALFELIPNAILPDLYSIMAETQTVVMQTIGPDSINIQCDIDRYGDENTPMIWVQLDCLLGKLYGFTTGTPDADGNARPNMLLASSAIGMASGFFFGGTFGVAVFFLLIGMLWSMFSLVLKVVTAFINAYLIIALYMIIAPLFLPLMFLRVTTQYFERWTSAIMAAVLMPIIICAYVVLALQLYDRVLFAPDALMNKLFQYDFVKDVQMAPTKACESTELAGKLDWRAKASDGTENQIYQQNPYMINQVISYLSGSQGLCSALNRTNIEMTKDQYLQLFKDAVMIFMVSWLIDAGFTALTGAIRPMLGSGAVAMTLDMRSREEERFQTALAQARNDFSRSFQEEDGSSVSGTKFLTRIPIAAGDGLKGLMNGFSNRQ